MEDIVFFNFLLFKWFNITRDFPLQWKLPYKIKITNYGCILGDCCSKTGLHSDEHLTWSPSSHLLHFHTDGFHATHPPSFWYLTGEDTSSRPFFYSLETREKNPCNSVTVSRWMKVYYVWRFVSEILYYYISIVNINNILIHYFCHFFCTTRWFLWLTLQEIPISFILLLSITLGKQWLR